VANPTFLLRLGGFDYFHRFTNLASILLETEKKDLALFVVISIQHNARFALCNSHLPEKDKEEYFMFFCPS